MSKPALHDLSPKYQAQVCAQLHATPKPKTVSIEVSSPYLMDPDTPRVSACFGVGGVSALLVEAKKLERELAAEKAEVASYDALTERLFERIEALKLDVLKLKAENKAMYAEVREQARLLGIGGERELRLMAERDQWRAVADVMNEFVKCYRDGCDHIGGVSYANDVLEHYNVLKGETK